MTDETRKLIEYIFTQWEGTDARVLQLAFAAHKAEKAAEIEKANQ